jgi:uncharacterized protein (DUF4415 family)
MKKEKLVEYELDLQNPPPLTPRQKAELEKLAAMPESEIDFSDIPRLDAHFWKSAVRGSLYKPVKTSKTIRVDADILLWLRSKGPGYQTRLNAILRQAMLREARQRTAAVNLHAPSQAL